MLARKIFITLLVLLNLPAGYSLAQEITNCPGSYSSFGHANICLPVVEGMKECYSNPKVKAKVNEFEFGDNSILGFYLKEDDYEKFVESDVLRLDEYFKIYGVNTMKDKQYSREDFDQVDGIISRTFEKDNWDKIKSKIEKNQDQFTVGQPVILEGYVPNEFTRSYLMAGKVAGNSSEQVVLMCMNISLLKEKLIWLGYYLKYENSDSLEMIRKRNDEVVKKFVEENG